MRSGNNIFSAVQFLFVVAVIVIGSFLAILPWTPYVRFKIANFLVDRPDLFFPAGVFLCSIGGMLLVGFYTMYRKRFFQVEMKAPQTMTFVEMVVLRSSVEKYCRDAFASKMQLTDFFLHANQKIEMVVQISDVDMVEKKALLEKAEKEIGQLLKRKIGYQEEFLMTVVMKSCSS